MDRSWWIKERYNPQLGTYWVALGRLSDSEARAKERSLYGDNWMHRFSSKEEYEVRLKELADNGERVL